MRLRLPLIRPAVNRHKRTNAFDVFGAFWSGTATWILLLGVLMALNVLLLGYASGLPILSGSMEQIGYFISTALPVAAFAGAIHAADALQRGRNQRTALAAFVTATLLLGLGSFANVGFMTPATQRERSPVVWGGEFIDDVEPAVRMSDPLARAEARWTPPRLQKLPPDKLSFTEIPNVIRALEQNWRVRESESNQRLRSDRWSLQLFQTLQFERGQHRQRIRELHWRLHFGIAWSLLPVVTAWLGLVTALFGSVLPNTASRRLLYWAVAGVSIWGTGFLISVTRGSMQTGVFLISQITAWLTFAVPVTLLLGFGTSWLMLGRRLQLHRSELPG